MGSLSPSCLQHSIGIRSWSLPCYPVLSCAHPTRVPSKKGETIPFSWPHTIMSAEFDRAIPHLVDLNVEEPFRNIEDSEVESNWDQIVNKFVFTPPARPWTSLTGPFFNSFDRMDLKPELLRGIYASGCAWPSDIDYSLTFSPIQFRASFRLPAMCGPSHHQGSICHRSGSARCWQDRSLHHLHPPKARSFGRRDSGSHPCTDP